MGCHAFDVETDAGNETTSTTAAKNGLNLGHVDLTEELVSNGTLTSNDIRIVKRRDVDKPILFFSPRALLLGCIEIITMKHNMPSQSRDIHVLDTRRCLRHHDGRRDLEFPR